MQSPPNFATDQGQLNQIRTLGRQSSSQPSGHLLPPVRFLTPQTIGLFIDHRSELEREQHQRWIAEVADIPGVAVYTVNTVVRTRHYDSLCADSWALKLSPHRRTRIERIEIQRNAQYRKLGIFLNLEFQAILRVCIRIRMDSGQLSTNHRRSLAFQDLLQVLQIPSDSVKKPISRATPGEGKRRFPAP